MRRINNFLLISLDLGGGLRRCPFCSLASLTSVVCCAHWRNGHVLFVADLLLFWKFCIETQWKPAENFAFVSSSVAPSANLLQRLSLSVSFPFTKQNRMTVVFWQIPFSSFLHHHRWLSSSEVIAPFSLHMNTGFRPCLFFYEVFSMTCFLTSDLVSKIVTQT